RFLGDFDEKRNKFHPIDFASHKKAQPKTRTSPPSSQLVKIIAGIVTTLVGDIFNRSQSRFAIDMNLLHPFFFQLPAAHPVGSYPDIIPEQVDVHPGKLPNWVITEYHR